MSPFDRLATSLRKSSPFVLLPRTAWARQHPTHREASPTVIAAALARSQNRPSGNWFAIAASADVASKPFGANVGGAELVCWRGADGHLRAGPAGCPHLGADLSTGRVDHGQLICPWHGLRLTGRSRPDWQSLPTFDDGVLVWVRLDGLGGEEPTPRPIVPARPAGPTISAVTSLVGTCDTADIIANRMDPWHGAWFHPYSFTKLEVLSAPAEDVDLPGELDRFVVAVTFRIGRLGIPVVAEFTSPEPRTLVMRIIDGEGSGSVVETHATPRGSSNGLLRSTVIEAVIAHSERPGFARALIAAPVIRPLARRAAHRLWRDDMHYAERLYAVRRSNQGARIPRAGEPPSGASDRRPLATD